MLAVPLIYLDARNERVCLGFFIEYSAVFLSSFSGFLFRRVGYFLIIHHIRILTKKEGAGVDIVVRSGCRLVTEQLLGNPRGAHPWNQDRWHRCVGMNEANRCHPALPF